MKHKHHDLIVQWVKDTSQKVWYYCEHFDQWQSASTPQWSEDTTYKIQEEQPTEPPVKKVSFFDGGIEFEKPLTVGYDTKSHGNQVECLVGFIVSKGEESLFYKALSQLVIRRFNIQ